MQDLTYHYDGFSNLDARIDNQRNLQETFTYDHLNRLTGIWLGDTETGRMDYDAYGRMEHKTADGRLVFTNAVYDETTRPHAIDRADTFDDVFSEQSVTYTCFDKVKTITQGNNTLEYTYGYDRQRIFMEEHTDLGDRTKRYVGNCELLTETTPHGTVERWLTCLVGPTGAFAMVETDDKGNHTLHYILKDNLGSWSVITDKHGNIEQELSFDAWGNLRDPDTWLNYSTTEPAEAPMFDRGFTGHEHITAFGLINMNGRCYDPLTSHFLSVDAYVQDPTSAQAFNRYAYCAYNPLRYTDPTGWLCSNANPIRQSNSANYNAETTWHSDDINDVLWGRSVHPCGNSSSGFINGVAYTSTGYTEGNNGLHGSNYTVDKQGYIKNVGSNDKTIDLLYTQDSWDNGNKDIFVEIPIGVLERRNTLSVEGTDGKIYTFDMYTIRDDELSTRVFEFLAANTDVEWSQTFVGNSNSETSILSTSHIENTETGQGYLLRNGWTIRAHNHSHPYHDYPSKNDLKWAKAVHELFPKVVLKIYYKNHYYEYDELGPLAIPGYDSNVLNSLNVLDTRIKP